MERHRTLDSSMSSLYSGSNISNTPSAHRQQHDNYNYPALSSSASPTPSFSGGGGGGGGASLGLLTGASSTNAIATTGGSNTTNATTGHASDMSLCSGDEGAGVGLRATTIGSVVVRCGPIQLVIALLQSPEKLYIKVVELEPKITTLGTNLDESIRLQRDHDETLRNIQNLPGPMDEFVQKADKLLTSKRISSELVNAMADTLNIIWQDILHLLQDRQHILHLATQFHEKMVQCQRRMDQLEVACIDTMLPIEVAAVQEFLNKFKQLRIDMLTAVMAALKDGNELLSQLKELVNLETLDTRPEHIKRDATRAVHQVQHWLEALHDRRNALESAWQTRKTQLEHCLTLALLGRELDEVETALRQQRNEIDSLFSLGECEHTANNALQNYREWKQHALQLRDRALKITRAKEKLQASGTFTGDEACARAYNVLSACTEHLDLVDQREHWLQQSRDFFAKAENTLSVLEKLEVELTNVRLPPNSPESFAMYSKVARDVRSFTEEPLRLGYSILDEVGRTQPETQGVKRVLDEIENRKTYIESVCSTSNQDHQRVQKALSDFLAQYNDLLNWLMTSGQLYLKQHVDMGSTLQQCKQFLLQHHELMQDLEVSLSIHIHEKLRLKIEYLIFQIKGELINLLLESIKAHLESLSPQQRYDVDSKAESLHKHWIELKDLVLKRVDYVSLLIEFFEKANELASQLDNLDKQLKQTPDEQKLQFLQENWKHIRADYADLKSLGTRFITLKIVDPYLETKSSVAAVEDILNGFSKRQVDVTTSLDNWTTQIAEKREVEIILEKIMSDNEETATKTTQVDTQLYPVFTSLSVDARQLHSITSDKLTHVLQDIDKAQDELQHRIHTTLGIQTKNSESLQKIEQVISNLRSLKSKLDGIRYDYKTLLENILKFLMEIIELRHSIDDFFVKQKQQQQQLGGVEVADIEHTIVEHEKFRDGCMDKFRSLITQSELLIDRVRALEPPGAREIDTDRILKLLENLRIHFEANNSERMSRLERLGKLEQFKTDLCDINRSLDSVSKHLNEINGQSVDSLAAAKTTSLAFEYFERTIENSMPTILVPVEHQLRWGHNKRPLELLEKRIEKFTDNTTQQLLITNPESESYVREELQKLNEKWRNFKDQVRNKRKSLDQAAEFFEMVEKIDAEYREINYFYNSVSNKITYLRDPVEASNLVNDIEKYVVAREGPLLGKLENAAQCAHDMNKVSTLYNDVRSIFQAFMKLKSDINVVQERLKNEERLREQREKEAHEQAERVRAAREAEAKERAAREAEEREQAARELAAREKALRVEEARLQAIREQAMREQTAREQAAREEEVRLQALREQTQRDEEARLHALREQARREEETRLETLRIEETRLQLLREQTKREEEARLQAIREQVARDEEVRLQALREQTVREEEARLQALREQANREEQKRLLELREQATREEEARLQTLREQANREEEKRLLAVREEEARLQALREQTKREEAVRLQSVRDQIDHQRIVTENIRKDIQVNEIFTEIKYVSPRFNRLLKDAITREGDKFTFECEVTGNPEPTVEWFKDGISIQNNPDYKTTYDRGVCRLVIEETFTADSARFSCHASNLVGSTDTSANLSVRENAIEMQMVPPRVIRYLESGKATEGSTFEFLCVVSGNPLPTVQWYKNDKCIDDSPDYIINYNNGEATLRFEEVFLEDDAVYTCSASNPAGIEHCSASLIVEPLEPTEVPHFKIPLTNAMARVGQKIKLEALIGGIPRPDIFWMHNGKPYVPRDSKYEYGRATLIIPQAYPNDAGVYVLTAKNLAGEVYSSCNVIVKGRLPNETSDSELASDMEPIKPSVQLPLKDVSIFEGKPVRLDCIIVGQPEPEVIWYHNERPVKESADVQLLFQGDRCSLIIQEVYQEDAGNYKVVAINSAGEASSSCELKVTPLNIAEPATRAQSERQSVPKETLPKFDKFLTDVLADEGETVEMEVIVSGDQPFTAKWYLANKELHENERISTSGNPASGVFKLTLRNVVADDRGVYTVKVSNNAGDAKCFSQLNIKSVNAPDHQRNQQVEPVEKLTCPEFKELFSDKQAHTDDMVKFECIVKGKPTPKVHWCFNDQPVHGHNFLVSTSGDRQVLTIQKASIDTVGKVSCIAENEIGKATCVAFLNLLGADMQLTPATSDLQTSTQEHNTESSRVTINKKTFTTTSTSQISSFEGNMPQTEIHHSSAHIDQSLKQLGTQQPELVETHHYQELHKSKEMPTPNIQQKSFTLVQSAGTGSGQSTIASMTGVSVPESPTRLRKQIAPRFTMPLTGRIVDQGTDVSMEAIYDGFPSPEIKVVKNGEQLFDNQRLKIENRCNRVSIELKQVGVADAGRYAITATNTMGQSTSTADLVVKKTIFPPVFGRRLQAQVVKRGEKIIMEVEVTGLPEPTVVWMKDDKPIEEASVSQHRLLSQGNSYKLIIEKGVPSDSGKYMVKATNAGGEAKSIADCAILEPSPERLQEVVKTIVYETPSSLKTEDYKSMSSMSSSYYNASNISNISNVSAPKYQPSPVKTPTPAPMPTAAPIPAQRKTPAEFSDYSSEVEERFSSVSRTQESDSDIKGYRVVFPPTPTPKSHLTNGHKSPVVVITPSPMEFEPTPPAVSTYPRQKFEPIQKEIRHEFTTESQEHKQHFQQQKAQQQQQYQQQTVYKPKPVAAKFIAATQQQQERQQHQPPTPRTQPALYYNAIAGTPLHMAKMATETKNVMHMKESSETCQRVVNMQQTKRVIHFDSQKEQQERQVSTPLEPFPYSVSPNRFTPTRQTRAPPPATPTKFVPGEFRESDYDSEIENAKIHPLWTPQGEYGPLRFRHVEPPQTGRACSVPRSYERVLSPMEFDRGPEMPKKIQIDSNELRKQRGSSLSAGTTTSKQNTQSLNRHTSMQSSSSSSYQQRYQTLQPDHTVAEKRFPRDDMNLKVGSPPKYGYIQSHIEQQGKQMSSSFLQKSHQFINDISSDLQQKTSKSTKLYNGVAEPKIITHSFRLGFQRAPSEGDNKPQAYRDESRVSQYDQGTQTDSLLITEEVTESGQNRQERAKSETHEAGACHNKAHSPSPQREVLHTIHKSESLSSSSGHSLGGSSPLGSATSTTSLHYSPVRLPSTRNLKNDTINTYQKWETTIESIRYVSNKTVAISDYGSDADRQRSDSISTHSQTTRSRSTTPVVQGPVPAARSTTMPTTPTSGSATSIDNSSSNSSSGVDSGCGFGTTFKATTTTTTSSGSNFNGSRISVSPAPKQTSLSNGSPMSVKQTAV
ncbi:titin homolog isoform X8 [Anastrepha ludens]|uniref:titin homolog isoform X8 n=1 Tax=Anastrepha ludens TaxID=28586 RepID=UPI0023B1E489|nr:titin homolog isoform X8 [Anastrepha ludens]